jgi:AcrR family transcriptional regulator
MARPSVKEQIVQAGLKILLDKGFNGVGVQEITETAGVPKGSFYNHFESKEARRGLSRLQHSRTRRRLSCAGDRSHTHRRLLRCRGHSVGDHHPDRERLAAKANVTRDAEIKKLYDHDVVPKAQAAAMELS